MPSSLYLFNKNISLEPTPHVSVAYFGIRFQALISDCECVYKWTSIDRCMHTYR